MGSEHAGSDGGSQWSTLLSGPTSVTGFKPVPLGGVYEKAVQSALGTGNVHVPRVFTLYVSQYV